MLKIEISDDGSSKIEAEGSVIQLLKNMNTLSIVHNQVFMRAKSKMIESYTDQFGKEESKEAESVIDKTLKEIARNLSANS